jgi:predicted CXXCH cytochrome family protein
MCHDLEAASFTKEHRGYSVGSGACAGCHDPHGSGKPGLTSDFTHAPYEERQCEACHESATELVAQGIDLCTSCHDDHDGDADVAFPHAALTEGDACLSCHQPHAGRNAMFLVRDDVSETCFTCHERTQFEQKVHHPDIGGCTSCHAPHGSVTKGLLVEDSQSSLCKQCHDPTEMHQHPFEAPARDPRTGQPLQCTSCHNPHSSNEEHLLTHEPTRQLCVQCHLGPNLQVQGRGVPR